MLLPLEFKFVKNIKFPVYVLINDDVETIDGLLIDIESGCIIDDKNRPGETLGLRRLQTVHKLKKLGFLCEDFCAMIRSGKLNFIDTYGRCFRYNKTFYTPIRSHKIKAIIQKDIGSVLKCYDLVRPLVIKRPPPLGADYALIMYINKDPYEVWGYSEDYVPSMKKKI